MAEDLKGLIEKINQEGVRAAEDRAKDIENEAKQQAEAIIDKAEKEAEEILAEARREAAKMEKSGEASLKQAGRDLLLSLRKEIDAMLQRLITERMRQTLAPQEMIEIITTLVKNYGGAKTDDIIVSLRKEDLAKIEKGFLSELKGLVKKGVALKPSEDIQGGFIISYDAGKSHFDFTDAALTEYIGVYLKPKLREILQSAAGKKRS